MPEIQVDLTVPQLDNQFGEDPALVVAIGFGIVVDAHKPLYLSLHCCLVELNVAGGILWLFVVLHLQLK